MNPFDPQIFIKDTIFGDGPAGVDFDADTLASLLRAAGGAGRKTGRHNDGPFCSRENLGEIR